MEEEANILNNYLLINDTESAENYIINNDILMYEIMDAAANKNYTNVINFIINYVLQFHIYDTNSIGNTIIVAVLNNNVNLIKILLNNNNINPAYSFNYAIKNAFNNGHLEIVKELLLDFRVISDPEIYTKFYGMILDLSLQQQLVFLLNVPQELCEIIQLFVFRNVY
jgi:hypothetical protein